jgi:hypothetical protein
MQKGPRAVTDVEIESGVVLIERELGELASVIEAGCTDLLLFPCSGNVEQVLLLAQALRARGDVFLRTPAGHPTGSPRPASRPSRRRR